MTNTDASTENPSSTNNVTVVSPGSVNSTDYATKGVVFQYESLDYAKNNGFVTPSSPKIVALGNKNVRHSVVYSTPSSNRPIYHWADNGVQLPTLMDGQNSELPSQAVQNNVKSANLGNMQTGLRYAQGISQHWSADEQWLLVQFLQEHANEQHKTRLFGLIAEKLNNKSIRDVALRIRWMKTNRIDEQQVEQHDSVTCRKRGRENSLEESESPVKTHMRGCSPAKIVSPSDRDDGNSLKDKVSLTMVLLNQYAEGLEKVSAFLADLPAGDNINTLRIARENILTAMENLKEFAP